MLHDFIARNRDEIIIRCRAKVATRSVPPPTDVEIDHGKAQRDPAKHRHGGQTHEAVVHHRQQHIRQLLA